MYCVSSLSSEDQFRTFLLPLWHIPPRYQRMKSDLNGLRLNISDMEKRIILSIFLYAGYSKHHHIGTLDVSYHMKAETIIQSICWHSMLDLWHAIIRGICGCIDKHLALSSMYRGVGYALNVWVYIKCKEFMPRNFRRIPSLNRVSIGSDNGLSPFRRQAIIWTNAGILLILNP